MGGTAAKPTGLSGEGDKIGGLGAQKSRKALISLEGVGRIPRQYSPLTLRGKETPQRRPAPGTPSPSPLRGATL
jgi:hypothetical protein